MASPGACVLVCNARLIRSRAVPSTMDCSAISRTRCTCLVIPTSVPVVSSAAAADSVSGGSIFGVRPYNAM
eukprot:3110565-Lingulodinium_polyedra.AAC.1